MKCAIYNPYLDTLGGGERYTMAVATTLFEAGYEVDVQWKTPKIKEKLENRFGIVLDGVSFVPDVRRGDGYDVCFWVSDGSIPTLKARKNLLHFQVPFHDVKGGTLLNRMKLYRINKVICNSNFTKKFIDAEYRVKSVVIYPPVDVEKIKPKRKKNIILNVGRFSQLAQAKRHDILIDAFKKLYTGGIQDWELILAGGIEVGAAKYLERLLKKAKGFPIKFITSPTFKEITNLYGKAKIFWSAAGFGVNESKEPERVEHFGISVVEAMAAKAVPIVFSAGGHKEIIEEGEGGYLWENIRALLKFTRLLVGNKRLLHSLSLKAASDGRKFGYDRFEAEFKKII